MRPGKELLQKWDSQSARLHTRMEITGVGLVLGAGTVLAKAEGDKRGTSTVTLDDEPRVAALLATAFEKQIGPHVLVKIGRACALWNAGEQALAHIHLAHAKLPRCGEDAALRLFVAEELLESEISPDLLLKAQGFESARLDLSKFNEDEPRVPKGNGRESGEWTNGQATFTPVAFRSPKERRGRGRGGSILDAIRSFLDRLRERRNPKESEPAQETTPPKRREGAESVVKPFGTLESDLSRPGYGEEVSIPGLPDDIKGTDVTKSRARMANYECDLTRDEFESRLSELGWSKEPSPDGKVMIYTKDGAKYVVRDDAKSTKGPTADFYHPGGDGESIDMKLRLRNE